MAGRPRELFTINLQNIESSADEILAACRNHRVKVGFQNLFLKLKDSLFEKSEKSSQTDDFNSVQFIELLGNIGENDIAFILDNVWLQLGEEQSLCSLYQFLESMTFECQKDFFSMLGKIFNQNLFDESISIHKRVSQLSMNDLVSENMSHLWNGCDERLQAFFLSATEKTRNNLSLNHINYLSNTYENLLKARNNNFVMWNKIIPI